MFSTDGVLLNAMAFPTISSVPRGIAISKELVAFVPLLNQNTIARLSVENARPELTVTGPRRRVVRTARTTFSGTAIDDAEISQVAYKLPRTRLRFARGTDDWSARLRVPDGRTRVRFRATDNFNVSSAPATIRLIRR